MSILAVDIVSKRATAHPLHRTEQYYIHAKIGAIAIAYAMDRVDCDALESQCPHGGNDAAQLVGDYIVVADEASLGWGLDTLEAVAFVPVGSSVAKHIQCFLTKYIV